MLFKFSFITKYNLFYFFDFLGALKEENEDSAFLTSSNSPKYHNKNHFKSQLLSSNSSFLTEILTFKNVWASVLVFTLINASLCMESTSASPVPHSHSSLSPTTSLTRRPIARRIPVYPIPASSSIRKYTASSSSSQAHYTAGNNGISRRGRSSQKIDFSSRNGRIQSYPTFNNRNKKVFTHGSPFERLTASVAKARQEDRPRRQLEEVAINTELLEAANYQNYDNYKEVVEEIPSEKELLMEELFDTKEKWINPCGINFSAVIPLNHVSSSDYAYEPLTDSELMQQIIIQVSKALRQSRRFKEDYVSKIYFFSNFSNKISLFVISYMI